MLDVMADLETMGRAPDGAILAIGACEFNIESGYIAKSFYRNVELKSSVDAGMTLDPDTVLWWMDQSKEARQALLVDQTTLYNALDEFKQFFLESYKDANLWCHATFDSAILDTAFALTGVRRPWHYKKVRDVRTLVYMWKHLVGGDEERAHATDHNALADAIYQAQYCSQMYKEIRKEHGIVEPVQ